MRAGDRRLVQVVVLWLHLGRRLLLLLLLIVKAVPLSSPSHPLLH